MNRRDFVRLSAGRVGAARVVGGRRRAAAAHLTVSGLDARQRKAAQARRHHDARVGLGSQ